jgi:hypothetical protein
MSTIPVARYAEWRAWLQRVDTLMHRGIRVSPVAAPNAAPRASPNASANVAPKTKRP